MEGGWVAGGVTVMLPVIAEIRGCQPTNPPNPQPPNPGLPPTNPPGLLLEDICPLCHDKYFANILLTYCLSKYAYQAKSKFMKHTASVFE